MGNFQGFKGEAKFQSCEINRIEVNRIGDKSMRAHLSLAFWFCHRYYFFCLRYILLFALSVILSELAVSIIKKMLSKRPRRLMRFTATCKWFARRFCIMKHVKFCKNTGQH